MSTYLLNVQRAIEQTHKLGDDKVFAALGDDYFVGWHEAAEDLTYGISCGSEHAVQAQIRYWVNPTGCKMLDAATFIDHNDSGDKGYYDRIVEINNLMENM
jgi:hypothetical protein